MNKRTCIPIVLLLEDRASEFMMPYCYGGELRELVLCQ
jgi:hypothetical protein